MAVDAVQVSKFLQYTGSNGAQVAAWVGSPIKSDNGSVLELWNPGTKQVTLTMKTGDWWSQTNGLWTAEDFADRWTLKSALTMDAVSVQTPVITLKGSVDREVVWNRPFPDTGYKIIFLPDATLIGKINVTVKTKTATGVTITISANLAVSTGGVLHVIGTT